MGGLIGGIGIPSPGGYSSALRNIEVPTQRTYPERLRDYRDELARRLKEADEAIEALEKNPEVEKVLALLSRVSF